MNLRTRYLAAPVAGIVLAVGAVSAGMAQPVSTHLPAHEAAADGEKPEWSYLGATGPSHWGDLGYPVCEEGKKQSPIDISSTRSRALKDPGFSYGEVGLRLSDNGYGVNADPVRGSKPNTVRHLGKSYEFLQFHHHAPSEHQVDGLHYPAEMHFVNRAEDGSLAVFGVMFKGGGATNKAWKPVLDVIADVSSASSEPSVEVDLDDLLPKDRRSYRYSGSLTTPPCTEGVAWTVFTTPVVLSSDQLDDMLEAYNGNARPVQPLNGRSVVYDRTSAHRR